MTFTGHIHNGTVVFDTPPPLADGTAVEVVTDTGPTHYEIFKDIIGKAGDAPLVAAETEEGVPTLYERLKDIIGKAEGLPEDFALNHEHYRHGTPKR